MKRYRCSFTPELFHDTITASRALAALEVIVLVHRLTTTTVELNYVRFGTTRITQEVVVHLNDGRALPVRVAVSSAG